MATHSLSPGFVKLYYTFSGIQHVMTLPVNPTETNPVVGEEPSFTRRNGTTALMSTLVLEWVTLVKAIYAPTAEFQSAEYWSAPTGEDPVWIYTQTLAIVGTSGSANISMSQRVMTFRTTIGGVYKAYFMECDGAVVLNTRDAYPFSGAPNAAIATYLIGLTNWILARDNGYPIAGINLSTKTNDALRKKRLFIGG